MQHVTELKENVSQIILAARMAAGFDFGARFRPTVRLCEPAAGRLGRRPEWAGAAAGRVMRLCCPCAHEEPKGANLRTLMCFLPQQQTSLESCWPFACSHCHSPAAADWVPRFCANEDRFLKGH